MRRFFMVWREGGSSPKYRHENLRGAQIEAERLAKENPGSRFVVLQSLCDFVTTATVYTRHLKDEDLPF